MMVVDDAAGTEQDPRRGPLDGIRVIDVSTILMGPLAARILGDLGADVIKVEPPGGDPLRNAGPMRSPGMGWNVFNLHRNKRSVVLDLKDPADYEHMLDLIRSSDVFVTNMRADACDRLGLDYQALSAVRPELVYCIANGFGSGGPYAGKAAYDDVIQAATGIASLPTWFGGSPGYFPSVIGDKISALHIVYAVIAALFRRERTGQGDRIEVPMAECVAAFMLVEHLSGAAFVPPEGPFGYDRLRTVHRKPYRVSDGWICLLPYTDRNWRDFFELVGRPELSADPRFLTRRDRTLNFAVLAEMISEAVREKPVEYWMRHCDELSIPAVPIVPFDELEKNDHFAAVGLFADIEHPTEGTYRLVRDPVRFGLGSGDLRRHAPTLGEHTEEVLRELEKE
jgi:crotonobetainyl-CoA:carnitine CoA-transferase CaiB-like acyl-CoA transferase